MAVLEPLRAQEQEHLSDVEKAQAQIRDDYLAWLRSTCESAELLGLTLKEGQNVRLGQVYVPAATRVKVRADPAKPFYEEVGESKADHLLLHRLGEESFYVPGAPGSGKSTFCRWLALLAADGAVASPDTGPEASTEAVPQALYETFVRRWYAAADPPHADEKAEGLHWHLGEREELRERRQSPMLLTALCILLDQGQKPPQDFY